MDTKNRAANELRVQADAIRAKMADPSVQMTKDEVEQAAEGIRALELRANTIAGFTPSAEIERQGGDELVRQAAPENAEAAAPEATAKLKTASQAVRSAFGGTNGYLRALAKGVSNMTPAQHRAHEAMQGVRAIIGTASDASGGEFLLPLQQEQSIFNVDVVEPGILDLATRYPVAGQSIRIPMAVQTDATGKTRPLSGISAVGIVGEGSSITAATPSFTQRLLTAYKYAAYTEISNEMLADDFTGDLSPVVTKLVGGDVLNSMNAHFTIDGTGSSQPLGALNGSNGALKKVVRGTASTISTTDVFAMYAAFTHGPKSRWLINRTALAQLLAMTLGSNTLVSFLPGLNGAPVMTLLGYPVVVCDLTAVLGTESDFALVNGAFYAVGIRRELSVESSRDFKFQNDVTAYRFIARGGGIPLPTATYALKASGGTKIADHSPFVTLDEAA